MIPHEAHSWQDVACSFRDLADENAYFAPMAAVVERLARSPYAAGLFPVKSMHTVRLYQQQRYFVWDDEIRVEYDSGEFVVRYFSGGGFRHLEPRAAPGVWMKRSPDGFAAFERCLHHVRWFVEYDGVGAGPSQGGG